MGRIRPMVKIHGGKYYLSDWVISHFPADYEQYGYIEPFFGGGSVFLNKNPSHYEVINDVDETIYSIVVAMHVYPQEFMYELSQVSYDELTFKNALELYNKPNFFLLGDVEKAVTSYIVCRMSRGGLRKSFAWSERFRGGKPGDLNAWQSALRELPLLAERLSRAVFYHDDFRSIFRDYQGHYWFYYLDPPYLHETRGKSARKSYRHEMTKNDHIELLNCCLAHKGKILLSGYDNDLYNFMLSGWNKVTKEVANHSQQTPTKTKKIECLWRNY